MPGDRARQLARYRVRQAHHQSRVARLDEVLVPEGAVAEVIAELDTCRDGVAETREPLDDLRLRIVEPVRSAAVEILHLVRGIPLDCELAVGDGGSDLADLA